MIVRFLSQINQRQSSISTLYLITHVVNCICMLHDSVVVASLWQNLQLRCQKCLQRNEVNDLDWWWWWYVLFKHFCMTNVK